MQKVQTLHTSVLAGFRITTSGWDGDAVDNFVKKSASWFSQLAD